MKAVCKKCKYCRFEQTIWGFNSYYKCLVEPTDITIDFVTGNVISCYRRCSDVNSDGHCKHFKYKGWIKLLFDHLFRVGF